jgi:hypothetical protein
MQGDNTEHRICDAMSRLLEGCPCRTDGRWTVTNLAIEAGVSRATANRYPMVLDRFRRAISDRREAILATRTIDCKYPADHVHILAQYIQARAMLRQQEERRASRADVLPFPRQRTGDVG